MLQSLSEITQQGSARQLFLFFSFFLNVVKAFPNVSSMFQEIEVHKTVHQKVERTSVKSACTFHHQAHFQCRSTRTLSVQTRAPHHLTAARGRQLYETLPDDDNFQDSQKYTF